MTALLPHRPLLPRPLPERPPRARRRFSGLGTPLLRALSLLTLCAATSGAHAQAGSWNEVLARAKQEGKVVLYTAGLAPTLPIIVQEFSKATGIKVEGQAVNAGPQRQRIGQSVQARQIQVDVLINNDTPFLDELRQANALQDLGKLPNKAKFPKEWWPGAWPLVGSFTHVVMVNTKYVDPKSIKSWNDILVPKYRDKVVSLSTSSGLGALTFYANLVDNQGPDVMRRLGDMKPALVATTAEGSQLISAGEKWIFTTNVSYNTVPLAAKGAPVADVYLPPVSVVPYAAVALKGPNPNAALLLVNWLVGREGQQAICGEQRLTCSMAGIPGSLPLHKNHKVYDPAEVAKRQDALIALFNHTMRK